MIVFEIRLYDNRFIAIKTEYLADGTSLEPPDVIADSESGNDLEKVLDLIREAAKKP